MFTYYLRIAEVISRISVTAQRKLREIIMDFVWSANFILFCVRAIKNKKSLKNKRFFVRNILGWI